MVETAKRVAEAGKPSPDPAPPAGAAVASNAAAPSRVWRFFWLNLVTVIVTLIVAMPVVTHIINVVDRPSAYRPAERPTTSSSLDALWADATTCSRYEAWRDADAQEYRLVTARMVEAADRSSERQGLMKAVPVLSQVLDMHEADESETLTFVEDLLASSKRAIPV